MALIWDAKVIAAAAADAVADADADAAAETNWKHKVTPDWGDLITEPQIQLWALDWMPKRMTNTINHIIVNCDSGNV